VVDRCCSPPGGPPRQSMSRRDSVFWRPQSRARHEDQLAKERLLGHPSVSAANAPATTQFAGLRRLAPPARATPAEGRASEPSVQDGGEGFGRPVVALVGRDCRIEPGEVVIARLTKLSRSVAGQLVVVRGARAGCDGLADAWEDIGDQHRVRACGDVRLRCEGAGRVGKSPPPERLGATAWILPYRASTHGVIGPTLSLVIELYAERRDRQLHLPGRSKPASRQPSRRPTRRCSRSGGWCCAAPPSRRRQRR
jgi:hypothetical protein